MNAAGQGTVRVLNIADVDPDPEQHRKHFDPEALVELAASIKSVGQLTPITVTEMPGGRFLIVAGERRYRACKLAGLETVRAEVRDMDDLTRASIQACENIARSDVRPSEEGAAYQRIIDEYETANFPADFDILPKSQQDEWCKQATAYTAQVTGSNFQRIGCKLRLLLLPKEVLAAVDTGALGEAHAQALTRLLHARELNETERAEADVEIERIARAAIAQNLPISTVRAKVAVYLGERSQLDMFSDDEVTLPKRMQVTRSKLAQAMEHLGRVVALTFSERTEDFSFGALTGGDLEVAESKLRGGVAYLQKLLGEVREAQGLPQQTEQPHLIGEVA